MRLAKRTWPAVFRDFPRLDESSRTSGLRVDVSLKRDIVDGFAGCCKSNRGACESGWTRKTSQRELLNGAPGEVRTPDLWFRRPSLYPAELRARCVETATN